MPLALASARCNDAPLVNRPSGFGLARALRRSALPLHARHTVNAVCPGPPTLAIRGWRPACAGPPRHPREPAPRRATLDGPSAGHPPWHDARRARPGIASPSPHLANPSTASDTRHAHRATTAMTAHRSVQQLAPAGHRPSPATAFADAAAFSRIATLSGAALGMALARVGVALRTVSRRFAPPHHAPASRHARRRAAHREHALCPGLRHLAAMSSSECARRRRAARDPRRRDTRFAFLI